MKNFILFYVGVFLIGLNLVAEESKDNEPSLAESEKAVARLYTNFDYDAHIISFERFVKMMSEPNVVILDLRTEFEFKARHIKGARHLGADVTKEKLAKLIPTPKTTIIVYCNKSFFYASRMFPLTHTLVPQIYALGYENVYFPSTSTSIDPPALQWEGDEIP